MLGANIDHQDKVPIRAMLGIAYESLQCNTEW